MATTALISEINTLTSEIKRRSQALRELRKRKKGLEARLIEFLELQLIEFLDNNNQRGVTFQGKLAIVKENTQKSTRRLRKNEKAMLAREFLEKNGIQNNSKLAQELVELLAGPKTMITKLKYQKL